MTDSLSVQNKEERGITVQIELFKWTQDEEGKDKYEKNNDIIFYPKIFRLGGKDKKIVRIGTKKKLGNLEQTYRLYVEEIPIAETPKEDVEFEVETPKMRLKMLVRHGVPIFISPEKSIIACEIGEVKLKQDKLLVETKNTGNLHFVINKVEVRGYDEEKNLLFKNEISNWYLLAGCRRGYEFDLKEGVADKLGSCEIDVFTDKKDFKGCVYKDKFVVD
jgi:fimbrial chaperone protein